MSLNAYLGSKFTRFARIPKVFDYPSISTSSSDRGHDPQARRFHLLIRARSEKVLILTVDGRTLTGTLLSSDQVTNLVLQHTVERIIRPPDDELPSEQQDHGVYMVRGDNVVVCGLVDEALDASIDWTKGSVNAGLVIEKKDTLVDEKVDPDCSCRLPASAAEHTSGWEGGCVPSGRRAISAEAFDDSAEFQISGQREAGLAEKYVPAIYFIDFIDAHRQM
nr:u6 snrna-associated sm-like protein lsm8 [Quercus suber]